MRRRTQHSCTFRLLPLVLLLATFLVPPTLGAAERGVKRTTLVSSAPVATPYLAGLYRALVIGNDDYEDAELVTPVCKWACGGGARIHNYSNRRGSFRICGNVPTNDRDRGHKLRPIECSTSAWAFVRSCPADQSLRHPTPPPGGESKKVSPLTD